MPVLLLITWLFVGIFYDVEFHEPDFFTKYRPTFKIFFYSTLGESNATFEELSREKQIEETAFREFVIQQDQQYNSNAPMGYVPSILFQLTLTCIVFGIRMARMKMNYKGWKPLVHFLVNLPGTGIGTVWMLWTDQLWAKVFTGIVLLVCNYLTAVFFARQRIDWSQ